MGLTDKYFLNGIDMYLAYGFIPSDGCLDSLMQEREAKERYSHDWPEENGKEFDLLAPVVFKERKFEFKGYIQALNYADYVAKKEALKAVLYSGVVEVEGVVGGRNYILKNTPLLPSVVTVNRVDNYLTIVGSQQSLGYFSFRDVINEAGEWTVSFWAKVNSTFPLSAYICSNEEHVFSITPEWQKFSFTSNIATLEQECRSVYFYKIQWITLEIKNVKVEKGNKATDWTPELKANAIAESIKTDKIARSTSSPFIMGVKINMTEVFV